MRRKLSITTATFAALAFLVGCGGGNNNAAAPAVTETAVDTATVAEPAAPADTPAAPADVTGGGAGHLVIWVDETRQGPVQAAVDAYKAANPGTEIELVQKNFDDIRTDFITQVPTGEGPDITVGAHDWLGELVTNGVVAPIELGAKRGEFDPVAVEAFTYDGQVYGVPYAIENIALIRNTDLAPEAPHTWDEMIQMGQAAGTEFPVLIQTGTQGDPFHYYPLQTSFGAPVFEQNADGSYNTTLALGGDNGHNFANWLAEQGHAGNLSTDITYDIAVDRFNAGASPFIIGGPWMISSFTNVPHLAIDPIPAPGPNPAQPFVGVQGFYLSSQSQNPLVATDFLVNQIATPEAQLALAQAGGRPPALTAAKADAFAADTTGTMEGFANVGTGGVPMPSIPQMGQVWQFWGVTQAEIIDGAANPAGTWDQMVNDIQGAIN